MCLNTDEENHSQEADSPSTSQQFLSLQLKFQI
jgi:hypothetical protein